MTDLNEQQHEAVTTDARTAYVIAGPGSGKTATMVARIKHRISKGADPRRMVVLTFTNAGAEEFVKRLAPIKPGYAGTLHGYCLRLLGKFGHLIGYRKGGVCIALLPEAETAKLIEAARDAIGLKKRITMTRVMEWKAVCQSGCFEPSTEEERNAGLVWRAYADTLKRNNMVDYDKILHDGLRLLRLDAVRSSLRVDELYVDETQDSGQEDWEFYMEFPAAWKFLVGDPDQSIYSFRGGNPRWLVAYSSNGTPHGGAGGIPHTILLDRNYRSDIRICEAASFLIWQNRNRIKKAVVPDTRRPGRLAVLPPHDTDGEEIATAYAAFFAHQRDYGTPYSEMAFLARTNAIVRKAATVLASFGLPIRVKRHVQYPHGWEKAILLVGLAIDPDNDIYTEKVLKLDGHTNVDSMKAEAAIVKTRFSLYAGLQTPGALDGIMPYLARQKVASEALAAVEAIIQSLPPDSGKVDLLTAMYSDTEALLTGEPVGEGVTVSTIHRAKGKEWDVVVLAGMEEGTLPQAKKDTDIEEERRLAFVGMTRARHTLILTSAKKRSGEMPWQTQTDLQPSRFLKEIAK